MSSVDVCFPLRGQRAPLDHGYALYSALSRVAPALHRSGWLAVHPLPGTPVADTLMLRPRAELRLRVPTERIGELLPLAGSTLDVGGHGLHLGAPRLDPLVGAAALDARLVVIKLTRVPRRAGLPEGADTSLDVGAMEPRFRDEVARQLAAIDIRRPFDLCGRGRMAVAGRRVVGFAVRVRDLALEESLRLQEAGLGGKRAMGCGVFRPTRGAARG